MNPTGLDVEARERMADRERVAAPLRIAAEGRRERLEWKSESRRPQVSALAHIVVAGIRRFGGLFRRVARRPLSAPVVTPVNRVAADPPG